MRICGVDPGVDGAIAFLVDGEVEHIFAYPTLQLKKGSTKRDLDYDGLAEIFSLRPVDHAFVEQSWVRPHEGYTSVLLGFYMATMQALATLKIPRTPVPPQVWTRFLGVAKNETRYKEASVQRAGQLMPQSKLHWQARRLIMTKKQAGGAAEAALIGLYGIRARPGSIGGLDLFKGETNGLNARGVAGDT